MAETEGRVEEALPRGLYRVRAAEGREVVAHATGGPRRNFVRLLVGDRVRLVLSPRDPGRGRIVERLQGAGGGKA
jgi:translation initiation factor IF-1